MRRSFFVIWFATACLASLIGPPASAAELADRVSIAALSQQQAQIFGRSLALVAIAPRGYTRGCCYDTRSGQWDGPVYRSASQPAQGAESTIQWGIALERGRPDEAEAARGALSRGWEVVELGIVFVAHVVGGREVGRIPGAYVVTGDLAGGQREAALSFPLASGTYAVARFALVLPERFVSTKDLMVQEVPLEAWNHEHALAALSGIRLQGNLPPMRVTARANSRARVVVGAVADRYGHPLVRARVRLQRRVGGRWTAAGQGLTGSKGNYRFRVGTAGTYRSLAGSGRKPVRSMIVRLGTPTGG